jgi:hypothetical protein
MSGNTTVSTQAYVYDQNNAVMANLTVTYSLAAAYAGVSINSGTGVVTVASTALPGTVTLKATYGALSGTATLALNAAANTSYSINAVAGAEYLVAITAENVSSFASVTYTLAYNASVLELTDFAAQTPAPDISAGAVVGTGLTIVSHGNGALTFTVTKTVPPGNVWNGAVTVIRFRAKVTGTATVSIT